MTANKAKTITKTRTASKIVEIVAQIASNCDSLLSRLNSKQIKWRLNDLSFWRLQNVSTRIRTTIATRHI